MRNLFNINTPIVLYEEASMALNGVRLVDEVTRGQIESAIEAVKSLSGTCPSYFSSILCRHQEIIFQAVVKGSFEEKGEGVPKALYDFLQTELAKM